MRGGWRYGNYPDRCGGYRLCTGCDLYENSKAGIMAAGLFILAFAVGKFSYLYESLKKIQQYVPVDTTYMNILMKMIGITYIGQFSAGICKDAGYSAVAGQIEIYERLAVLAISMPILTALLETIHGFLG